MPVREFKFPINFNPLEYFVIIILIRKYKCTVNNQTGQ